MVKHVVLMALAFTLVEPGHAEPIKTDRSMSESLGWLIGTWEEVSPTSTGSPATEMSFRWAAGREVILWEGNYAAEEATWSFAAIFFFDPIKDRVRVFAFNSHGQRHLGILTKSEPGTLAWGVSGILPNGRKERFVMEFNKGEKDTLIFNLRDRRPDDGSGDGNSSVKLRRTAESGRDSKQ